MADTHAALADAALRLKIAKTKVIEVRREHDDAIRERDEAQRAFDRLDPNRQKPRTDPILSA